MYEFGVVWWQIWWKIWWSPNKVTNLSPNLMFTKFGDKFITEFGAHQIWWQMFHRIGCSLNLSPNSSPNLSPNLVITKFVTKFGDKFVTKFVTKLHCAPTSSPVAFFASVRANKNHTDFYSSKIIMAIWLYVLQPFEILTLGNSGNATNATIKQTMQLKLQQLHWNNDITIIC